MCNLLARHAMGDLYVSSSRHLHRFDPHTGAYLGKPVDFVIEAVPGIAADASGKVYICGNNVGVGFVGVFTPGLPGVQSVVPSNYYDPKLTQPSEVSVGPDGNVYVASTRFFQFPSSLSGILRFNRNTGAFIDNYMPLASSNVVGIAWGTGGVLWESHSSGIGRRTPGGVMDENRIAAGVSGLLNPTGLAVGADARLYVASSGTDSILRYNSLTGALVGTFVPPGSGGLDAPGDIEFGPDGNLYVVSNGSSILRYDGSTGDFLGVFATTPSPLPGGWGGFGSIVFGADVPESSALAVVGAIVWSVAARRPRLSKRKPLPA